MAEYAPTNRVMKGGTQASYESARMTLARIVRGRAEDILGTAASGSEGAIGAVDLEDLPLLRVADNPSPRSRATGAIPTRTTPQFRCGTERKGLCRQCKLHDREPGRRAQSTELPQR